MLNRALSGLLALSLSCLPASAVLRVEASNGAAVEITARALQPGEVLLATFHPSAEGQKAKLTVFDRDHEFTPGGPGGKLFSLVGVDLLVPPGSHRVEVVFVDENGTNEVVHRYLRLHPRSFARRNIVLEERLVTAPPEVEERLARERKILAEVYRGFTPQWLGEGDFTEPLPDIPSPNFGEHRSYNGVPRSRHTGVDISAEEGAPVRASNSGRVALAMDLYYSGNTVIIDHGLNMFTLYCHCARLEVREGQVVRRGDVIAAVGSTGRSTGPHLHWGVRLRGARVDPLSLLALRLE